MYLTVFLGCLVGVVVVAQTLYTSTMEHIKEFGTVKAIGGCNADIYRILGEQASIAAVVGFAVGAGYRLRRSRPAMAKIDLKLIITPRVRRRSSSSARSCSASPPRWSRSARSPQIDPALVFRG